MSSDPRHSDELITSISVYLATGGDDPDDGTQGGVSNDRASISLGIAGREFGLARSDVTDQQRDSADTYVLGEGGNVVKPDWNDPRRPRRTLGDLIDHPVYVRFTPPPDVPDDDWHLSRADVTVTGANGSSVTYSAQLGEPGVWLGSTSGQVVHLDRRHGSAEGTKMRASDRNLKTAITPVAWR
ncbi:hypothetical protein [Nonomuraea sp. KM90]|uniref:hypothetical protein n=1 Tax=Nonomuraea sp. KM90 TaxID=3457428 RepID=UPI003FCE9131